MTVNLDQTFNQLGRHLVSGDWRRGYKDCYKLQSQLLSLIYDEEEFGGRQESFAREQSSGAQEPDCVTLTIHEPLPDMKALTAAITDHWNALIQSAITQSAQQEQPLYFEKAMVEIEVTTPRGRRNIDLWDTSNRAINLIINNLKGTYFRDDNLEHMAFSVVGKWGGEGQTVVKISAYQPCN